MMLRARIARLERLQATRRTDPRTLDRLRADRANVLALAGMIPDPWQAQLLRERPARGLVCCSRQSGKSETAAADALATALLEPGALVLLLAPTQRQSSELFRKVVATYRRLGCPVPAVSLARTSLELATGSRVVALPGDPAGIVGFSAPRLVVLDEAARVRDDLYLAVRPMLAVGRGRLLCCSTPFGKRGFFHAAWDAEDGWHRVRVSADQCPRITPAFLDEERRALGQRWFAQEYECSFQDATDSVFSHADIMRAVSGDVAPLFPTAA